MVLESHVSGISTQEKNLFHQFISLTMSSGKFQVLYTVCSWMRMPVYMC